MMYFMIETDEKNRIPYNINRNRAIDIRYANKANANKIPNCCIVDMQIPREVFYPDIMVSPLLLVSEIFAGVIAMYLPEVFFKTIYLLHYESGENQTYFMPFLEEIDCLSDKTVMNIGKTDLKRIVLRKEIVNKYPIFRVRGFTHPYVIGREDLVESILRRRVKGIALSEVKIEEN